MTRKLILLFAAFALVIVGLGLQGLTGARAMAAMSGDAMAMSDCASMMGMGSDQEVMDCGAMSDHGGQNLPAKCTFKDCSLRGCSIFAFQLAVSLIAYSLPVGPAELRPDVPLQISSAGKPPLHPPRFSVLT